MGSITQKLYELLSEGSNIEESRSIELLIRSTANFIDAAYGETSPDTSRGEADTNGHCEDLPPDENKSVK